MVKSRSNSRGSILEDYLLAQSASKNTTMNMSLSTILGNTDYDNPMGTNQLNSQTPSFVQGYYKVHESSCK